MNRRAAANALAAIVLWSALATLAVRLRQVPPLPDGDLSVGYHHAVQQARDSASRDYLSKLMAQFRGNVTQAATHARMTRESLHRVLRKYAVDFERNRST